VRGNEDRLIDPYLFIPLILGVPAWLLAKRRHAQHPIWWGAAFFLAGCMIVLFFDLSAPPVGEWAARNP
jgi:hypothetical protein